VLGAVFIAGRQEGSGLATTPVAFRGMWRVHGGSLQINADLTGELLWNAGPCGVDSMCTCREAFVFLVDGDRLLGHSQSSGVEDANGKPGPEELLGEPGERPTGTVTVSMADVGVLKTAYDPPREGNPYLCSDKASATWKTECNV
jgi:hypothetical protein